MLDLSFALDFCWYLIFIDKHTFIHFEFHYQQMFVLCYIIVILHSPGLIANASIIFITPFIDPSIVRALFPIYLSKALLQTSLRVNEAYTSSKTSIFTHLSVNIQIFCKSVQLYLCSVLNYILYSFYLCSRIEAGLIR